MMMRTVRRAHFGTEKIKCEKLLCLTFHERTFIVGLLDWDEDIGGHGEG